MKIVKEIDRLANDEKFSINTLFKQFIYTYSFIFEDTLDIETKKKIRKVFLETFLSIKVSEKMAKTLELIEYLKENYPTVYKSASKEIEKIAKAYQTNIEKT